MARPVIRNRKVNPAAKKYIEEHSGEIRKIVFEALKDFPTLRSHADDVAQRVAMNLLALDTFESIKNIRQYIRTSARNDAIDMVRGQKAHESIHEAGRDLADREKKDHSAEESELLRLIHRMGSDFSPIQLRILLRRGLGDSYEEIARDTGLKSGTVKSNLFRIKEKLAARFPSVRARRKVRV